MTAKELKEKAQIIYKPNELKKPQYLFTKEGFEHFCQQLCREQRSICSNNVSGWPDKILTESEIEENVLHSKMPEL